MDPSPFRGAGAAVRTSADPPVEALLAATGSSAYAQNTLPQLNDAYFRAAQSALQQRLQVTPNTSRAKNVILFVGDGMGISTVTAGRIYEGQKRGVDGESNSLTMEKLPFAALSKTYTHDAQVADSAPTAVAMVTGVKTRNDVIGVNSDVAVGDCAGSRGKEVLSLAAMAERAGQATGVVSTARITRGRGSSSSNLGSGETTGKVVLRTAPPFFSAAAYESTVQQASVPDR